MLNIYEEYPSREARETACMFESACIAFERAKLQFDTIKEMEALNIREAELRFVYESADSAALYDYYTEAEEKTNEDKKGILQKLYDALTAAFKSFREKFGGKKAMEIKEAAAATPDDEEVEVEEGVSLFQKFFKETALPFIKNMTLTKLAKDIGEHGLLEGAKKTFSDIVEKIKGFAETPKKIKVRAKLVKEALDNAGEIEGFFNKWSVAIKTFISGEESFSSDKDTNDKAKSEVMSDLNSVLSPLGTIKSWCQNVFSKNKKKEDGEKKEGEKTEGEGNKGGNGSNQGEGDGNKPEENKDGSKTGEGKPDGDSGDTGSSGSSDKSGDKSGESGEKKDEEKTESADDFFEDSSSYESATEDLADLLLSL